jgi:aldehyde dehydrogenase (NAD+)
MIGLVDAQRAHARSAENRKPAFRIRQLSALAAAIAAGNGVTLKPSEHAPATAEALRELVEDTFSPQAVSVRLGGPELAASLAQSGYD